MKPKRTKWERDILIAIWFWIINISGSFSNITNSSYITKSDFFFTLISNGISNINEWVILLNEWLILWNEKVIFINEKVMFMISKYLVLLLIQLVILL